MALFGVKRVLEMILSHTALSSFNMSSYPVSEPYLQGQGGETGRRDGRAAGAGGRAPEGTKTIEKKDRESTAKKRKDITKDLNVWLIQIFLVQRLEIFHLILQVAPANTSVLAYGNADKAFQKLYG